MNIGIIGLGYVGLTLAVVSALKKIKVFGVERSDEIKSTLRNKKAHFFEPGLDALISAHFDKNLFLVDRFSTEQLIDAFIITVGTPLKKGEKSPNMDHILSSLDQIKGVYNGDQLVILRSTISVGTSRNVVIPYLAKLTGRRPEDLLVAFCPERTIEGKAVRELQELPQIIGANNPRSLMLAENYFREITPTIIKVDSLEAAELIKLFNNTYRDVHFAIGNVFNEIAQSFGINGVKLIKAANMGYERSNIPAPGLVGGPCLEKDPYILTDNMKESAGKQFVHNARRYNESLEDKIVDWVNLMVQKNNLLKRICISGLAFKGTPDTSDLRGSNTVNIAKKLSNQGYEIRLHDFLALSQEVRALNIGEFSDDIIESVKDQSMLLIMNNNSRYAKIDVQTITALMTPPRIILDAWGIIDFFDQTNFHENNVYTLGSINL